MIKEAIKNLFLFQALFPIKTCNTSSIKDISLYGCYFSVLFLPDLYFITSAGLLTFINM